MVFESVQEKVVKKLRFWPLSCAFVIEQFWCHLCTESNDLKLTEKYSNKMSSEADLKDLKEQLGKTVDTYVKYIDVDTGATVSQNL